MGLYFRGDDENLIAINIVNISPVTFAKNETNHMKHLEG